MDMKVINCLMLVLAYLVRFEISIPHICFTVDSILSDLTNSSPEIFPRVFKMGFTFSPSRLASLLHILLLTSGFLVDASAIPNGEKRQYSACRHTKVAIL